MGHLTTTSGNGLEVPASGSHTGAGRAVGLPDIPGREVRLPRVSPMLLRLFRWYGARFVRRHFHALRLAGDIPVEPTRPIVAYSNHASWWDPLSLMVLSHHMAPGRSHFAPVDAKAMGRYAMFRRLGFFGVEQNTRRGAIEFLRTSQAILNHPGSALWLTPQGRFADVRERPAGFQRGMGALAARCRGTLFVPIAMEYTFWEERLPEALIRVGRPILVEDGSSRTDHEWMTILEQELLHAQDQLSQAAIHREVKEFQTLLQGAGGTHGIYDSWRALKARWRGESFRKEHGTL